MESEVGLSCKYLRGISSHADKFDGILCTHIQISENNEILKYSDKKY